MRKFKVANKQTDEQYAVDSVFELSKLINVPIVDIPYLRLWEYEVGKFVIYEVDN